MYIAAPVKAAAVASANSSAMKLSSAMQPLGPRRPHARGIQLLHRLIGKLRPRRVPADHEHQDRFLVRVALCDVLEAADHPRRERDHVERIEIDAFHLAVLVLPARAPPAGHRDEGLVGVVIVHQGVCSENTSASCKLRPRPPYQVSTRSAMWREDEEPAAASAPSG